MLLLDYVSGVCGQSLQVGVKHGWMLGRYSDDGRTTLAGDVTASAGSLRAGTVMRLELDAETVEQVRALLPEDNSFSPRHRVPHELGDRFPWLLDGRGLLGTVPENQVTLAMLEPRSPLPGAFADLAALEDAIHAVGEVASTDRWSQLTSWEAVETPVMTAELQPQRKAVANLLASAADFAESHQESVRHGARHEPDVRRALAAAEGTNAFRYADHINAMADTLRKHAGGLDIGHQSISGRLLGSATTTAQFDAPFAALNDALIGAATWLVDDQKVQQLFDIPQAPRGFAAIERARAIGRALVGHL